MQPISVSVEKKHEVWTIFFDGATCKHGYRASIIFKSLEGHMRRFSFRFTWICTNNATEYEDLCLGLYKAISMRIRCLVVHGDSKLVINQIKNKINARHHYIKTYRNRIWNLMKSFLDINFISIPRKYNQITDALAGKGVCFNPTHHKRSSYGVKVLCRPYVPNIVNFYQVSNFDEYIMNFLIDEAIY